VDDPRSPASATHGNSTLAVPFLDVWFEEIRTLWIMPTVAKVNREARQSNQPLPQPGLVGVLCNSLHWACVQSPKPPSQTACLLVTGCMCSSEQARGQLGCYLVGGSEPGHVICLESHEKSLPAIV